MRIIHSIVLASILTTLSVQANDQELKDYINSAIDDKLSGYNELKKENIELNDRVDELEDYIDSVETRTLIDKINFGIGFNTAVNSYSKNYTDGHSKNSKNIYTTKLSLNMNSEITKNMKFSGRLSMYKYWADSSIHNYARYDNMQGRVPGTSALFVERAYVDWKFLDDNSYLPTVLTIGRQPSSDGPSHQFKANTTRKATYSALVFDGASDGIVLTSSLKNVISLKDANIRLAYGKGFQNDETSPFATNAFLGADNSLKDTDVYGAFFESSLFDMSNTLFQVGFSQMSNIIANSLETKSSSNKNIGDATFVGIMFEGTDIKESGVDLFAHYSYVSSDPSHSIYSVMGQKFSLLGDGNDFSSKSADAFWLGGRYSFENSSKIGLEYNHGSKYWISATQGSFDLLNKLATRGDAYEAYYIYPINRNSFIRVGGVYIDYDYTHSSWFLGEPKKFDSLNENEAKGSIESVSNLYLNFGLNF